MTLSSSKFALAAILTTAIVWVICSLLVFLFPLGTMMASGNMLHMNTQEMMWLLTWSGFITGLIVWSLSVGLSAWVFALIYNRLIL